MSDIAQAANTDRELWREREGDYYAPSLFVTEGGGIGINVGGLVYVGPIREWHSAMRAMDNAPPRPAPSPAGAMKLSESERHAIGHAQYLVDRATTDKPEVCFDYTLVATLLGLITRLRSAPVTEEMVRWRAMAETCAIAILQRLLANYQTDRDDIADSDLDNEQPISITFRGTLLDIRNARKSLQCYAALAAALTPGGG